MKGSITITVTNYNGTPGFVLKSGDLNSGIVCKPDTLNEGSHTFEFTFDPASTIQLYITGKDHDHDTQVHDNGSFGKDKHIKIENIILEYLMFNSDWLYAMNIDPYLGFNERVTNLEIPDLEQWPGWYLTVMQTVNNG